MAARSTSSHARALGKAYEPAAAEQHWYQIWQSGGYFKPVDRGRGPFVIIMPPPNVTGELHMGHALFTAVEDILTRYKRMQGYAALWLPGGRPRRDRRSVGRRERAGARGQDPPRSRT